MASLPTPDRPRVKFAMLTLFLPMVLPKRPMIPGTSSLVVYSMCAPISASMLMPLIWMKRGLPSLKQVPATDRSRLSVTIVTLI